MVKLILQVIIRNIIRSKLVSRQSCVSSVLAVVYPFSCYVCFICVVTHLYSVLLLCGIPQLHPWWYFQLSN